MHTGARRAANWAVGAVSSVIARSSSWIERQEPGSRSGTTVGWFRLYRRADGQLYAMLLSGYVFVTVIPAMLVIATYVYRDPNRLSDRLAGRLDLGSATSSLLHGVLVGASSHRLISTMIAVANIILFGSGYGRILQLAHARAWRLDLGTSLLGDRERYLSVLAVLVGLVTLWLLQSTQVADGSTLGLTTVPLWLVIFIAYFVWAPRLLLHRRVTASELLPGALFIGVGVVVMRLAGRIVLARWLTAYSSNYGGFGIVLAIYSWLIVFGTLVVVGAALSPQLAARRELRRGEIPRSPTG